ncbi:MAG: hypothetical protein ACK52R_04215 [Betaproteobacteria bacterium]|jgi:hypothetical protein|nr:hypothetical protein [Rubrivivax sp.]
MEQQQDPHRHCKSIDINALIARLNDAPPPTNTLSRTAALNALRPTLIEAIARGHTPASLAAVLKEGGLRIAARSIAEKLAVPSKQRRRRRSTTGTDGASPVK